MKRFWILLFASLTALTACTSLLPNTVAPTQAPLPTYTPPPTYTPFPTYTLLPVPTQVPTQAPAAGVTRSPTAKLANATAPRAAVTADSVVAAFKAAKLEAENARKMAKDDYGLAPMVCDGRRFLIPSIGTEVGGRVFFCSDAAERDRLVKYYTDLGKGSAALFSWVFVKGSIVVQINGSMKEDLARKYQQAIP